MNEFAIGLRTRESVSVIDLHGYLDAHTAPELEKTFQNQIDARKYQIVVNFRELGLLKQIIRREDPAAFVVVTDTREVMGHRIGNQPHW